MRTFIVSRIRKPTAPSSLCFRNYATAAAVLVVCCSTAHAQGGGLTQIQTVASAFVTWLRALGVLLGVGAVVWGGINMMFTQDFGRGMPKVLAGICGLIIAGYAQEIVDMFYTTTS